MSNKHKKNLKHKTHKKTSHINLKEKVKVHIGKKCDLNEFDTSIFESNSYNHRELNYKFEHKKINPPTNSYPYANLGYNFPNPSYSAQVIRRPDDNKFFHNYIYNYNVQINKPTLTYNNYVAHLAQKNMSNKERKYYEKINQQYFYYNGTAEVVDNKPVVLSLQTNLNYPTYANGPTVGEMNGQIGYNQQVQRIPSKPMINSNDLIGLNNGNVQIYTNSPAYYGVQSKSLPFQNSIPNINNQFFH